MFPETTRVGPEPTPVTPENVFSDRTHGTSLIVWDPAQLTAVLDAPTPTLTGLPG